MDRVPVNAAARVCLVFTLTTGCSRGALKSSLHPGLNSNTGCRTVSPHYCMEKKNHNMLLYSQGTLPPKTWIFSVRYVDQREVAYPHVSVAGTSNSLLFWLVTIVIIKISNCHHCWTGSFASTWKCQNTHAFSHTVHFCSTSVWYFVFVPVSLRTPPSKTCRWFWSVGDHRPEQAPLTEFTHFAPTAL